MQKQFWKIFFYKKKCFWIFCPKKWLTSAVKKKMKKNIFFTKTNLEKTFFYKKQIGKYFFGKKNLEIFFSLFSRGGQLSGKFGYTLKCFIVTSNLFSWQTKKNFFRRTLHFRHVNSTCTKLSLELQTKTIPIWHILSHRK